MSTDTSSTTPAAPAAAAAKPLDEFGRQALARLIDTINQYNNIAAQVKAATGDPQSLLDTLRTSSDDPQVQKLTAAIEELDNKREALWNKRDEILKPIVEAKVTEAKSGMGDSEAVAKDLLKTVRSGQKYITDLYGEAHLESVPKVLNTRTSTGSSDGRSGQRVRGFDVFVDGNLVTQETKKDGKTVVSSNLAVAGKQIGVETADLREQFQAAAGTTDPKAYPAVVEFAISAGEGDARRQYTIRCVKTENESSTEAPAAVAASAPAA